MSIFLTLYLYLLLNWKSPKLAYDVKGYKDKLQYFRLFRNIFKRSLLQGYFNSKVFGQPFHKQQILDSSKLEEFADDNFKFTEVAKSSPKG